MLLVMLCLRSYLNGGRSFRTIFGVVVRLRQRGLDVRQIGTETRIQGGIQWIFGTDLGIQIAQNVCNVGESRHNRLVFLFASVQLFQIIFGVSLETIEQYSIKNPFDNPLK